MKKIRSILLFVFCTICILVKADIIGPFLASDSRTADGYARVVCVMYNTEYGGGTITISDENGIEYTLEAHANGGVPNCYLVKIGTYSVVSFSENCRVTSNWEIAMGSIFTVGVNGYMGITRCAPATDIYVYGPYLKDTSGDIPHDGFIKTMVVPVRLNEYVELSPVADESINMRLMSNYNTINSVGKIVPYIYYIKPGTYKITSISGSRASYNYNLNRVYVGKTVDIKSENMFYLTE